LIAGLCSGMNSEQAHNSEEESTGACHDFSPLDLFFAAFFVFFRFGFLPGADSASAFACGPVFSILAAMLIPVDTAGRFVRFFPLPCSIGRADPSPDGAEARLRIARVTAAM
jgi:hypothetical protein